LLKLQKHIEDKTTGRLIFKGWTINRTQVPGDRAG